MIDLDTFMVAPVLIDLGDAFRSWMQSPDGTFDQSHYHEVVRAYRSVNKLPYSNGEILGATKLISLELATRFLTDYFEESYFKWDNEKYASATEHNLFRCRYFIRYAESIPV